jgi:hypothetical protein
MVRKHFVMILTALVVASMAMPAAAKPDFSGTWKLVADKSDFGPMPPPEKYEQVVAHKDPELKLSVAQVGQQGELKSDMSYNTEGKETTNEIRGNAVKSTAKWDGDALVIESKLDLQGNELKLSDKWVLSEDGKTLTMNRKINAPQGEFEMKMVLAKE